MDLPEGLTEEEVFGISPSTTIDKINTLSNKKQEKLDRLATVKGSHFADADSTYKIDGQQFRTANFDISRQGGWVDAPESPATAESYGIYNPELRKREQRPLTQKETDAYRRSILARDNFLAGTTPASPESWEEEKKTSMTDEHWKMYEDAMKPYRKELEVDAYGTGEEGTKGRQLADFINVGYNPEETLSQRLLETGNATVRGNIRSLPTPAEARKGREIVELENGYLGNLVDAAQYGVGRFASEAADAVVDAGVRAAKEVAEATTGMSEEEANKRLEKNTKDTIFEGLFENGDFVGVDEYKTPEEYGYDDKRIQEYTEKAKKVLFDDETSAVDKVLVALEAITHAPEVLASSAGEILAAGNPVGIAALGAGAMNRVLENRAEAKGTTDLDAEDYGIALAAGIVYTSVNKLTNGMAGLKEAKTAIKEAAKHVDAGTFKVMMTAGKKIAANMGKNAAVEGIEEIIQESAEVVGSKIYTPKEDEILTEETAKDLTVAGLLGAGAGAGTTGAGEILATGKPTLAAIQAEIAKRKTKKVDAEEATTEEEGPTIEDIDLRATTPSEDINQEYADIVKLEADVEAVGRENISNETAEALRVRKEKIVKQVTEMDEDKPIVYGSSETAIDSLTYVLDYLEEQGKGIDEAVLRKVDKIADANGISKERIKKIKDMYTVEKEATVGPRGYQTYKRRIDVIMNQESPDKKALEKELSNAITFYESQEDYARKLERGIKDAELKLATYKENRIDGSPEVIELPPETFRQKASKYTISITKEGIPSTKGIEVAKELLERKHLNVKGLKEAIEASGKEIKDVVGDIDVTLGSTDSFVIPKVATKKIEDMRKRDRDSLKKHNVTKALLGKNTTKGWAEYRKIGANQKLINAGEYTPEDTVVINIELDEGHTVKDFGPNNYKEFFNELKKVKKSGATVLIDHSMQDKDLRKKISTAFTGFGPKESQYRSIISEKTGQFSSVLKPITVAEKENLTIAEKRKVKAEKKTTLDALTLAYAQELSENLEEGTSEELQTALQKAEKHFIDTAKGDKEVAKENMLKMAKAKVEKQVDEFSYGYFKSMVSHKGAASSGDIEALKEDTKISNKAIVKLATDKAKAKYAKVAEYEDVLSRWNKIEDEATFAKEFAENLDTKTEEALRKDMMQELFAKIGVEEGEVLIKQLDNSISKGSATVFKVPGKAKISRKRFKSSEKDKKAYEAAVAKGEKPALLDEGRDQEIVTDINKVVSVKGTTIFNTLSTKLMGPEIMALAEEGVALLTKSLKKVEFVKKDADEKTKNSIESRLLYDLVDSPARGLVFDKNGEINENVAGAMMTALTEVVANNSYMMSAKKKSAKDVANMLGVEEFSISTKDAAAISKMGMLNKTLANSLGGSIASLLGIKPNSETEVDLERFEQLKADLGQMAITTGITNKLLEYNTVPSQDLAKFMNQTKEEVSAEATTRFVRIPEKHFGTEEEPGRVEKAKMLYKELSEKLPSVNTLRKDPHFTELSDKVIEKRLNKIANDSAQFEIGDEGKEALINLMKQEWKVNFKLIKEVLANPEAVKKTLGYIDITDEKAIKDMSFDDVETQEAVNRDIEKSIAELEALYRRSEGNEDTSLYFEWFYTKNGRYMMDSNTINPQTDKQLHRFIVTPKEHSIKYDVKVNEEGEVTFSVNDWVGMDTKKHKDKVKGKDVTRLMHYALGQAFGFAVDKKSNRKVSEFSSALLQAAANNEFYEAVEKDGFLEKTEKPITLAEAKKKFLVDREFIFVDNNNELVHLEIEHYAHALQGFEVLEQLHEGTITSSITAEYDAVTSGFGLKILQMPIIGKVVRYALKVGIVPKVLTRIANDVALQEKYFGRKIGDTTTESWEDFEKDHQTYLNRLAGDTSLISMNDMLDEGGMFDSYQTLATKIKNVDKAFVKKNIKSESTKGNKKYVRDLHKYRPAVDAALDSGTWGAIRDLLPAYSEIEGKVSSQLRSLFKDPFMTFNYSASIKSIRASLSYNLANDLINDILKAPTTEPVKGADNYEMDLKRYKLAKGFIENTAKTGTKYSIEDLQHDIRTKPSDMIKLDGKTDLRGYLETIANLSYGAKVQETLESEFGPFLKMQEAINASFKAMFHAYYVDYTAEVAKVKQAQGRVTVDDKKAIIIKLQSKFPAIKGPFTGDNEAAKVGIYDTKTASPSDSIGVQTKVDDKWSKEYAEGQKSMVVWHKIKEFEAAISAGSVVPIHFIDGAILGRMINSIKAKYGSSAVTAIHDAKMPPLVVADETTTMYNQHTAELEEEYEMVEEIFKAIDNVYNSTEDKRYVDAPKVKNSEYKEVTVRELIEEAREGMKKQLDTVREAKEVFRGLMNEDGTYFMHVAGSDKGVYFKEPKADTKAEDVTILGLTKEKSAIANELIKGCQ